MKKFLCLALSFVLILGFTTTNVFALTENVSMKNEYDISIGSADEILVETNNELINSLISNTTPISIEAKEEILELFKAQDELNLKLALLKEENSTSISNSSITQSEIELQSEYESQIDMLQQEINALGVNTITESQAQSIMQEDALYALPPVPSNSSDVQWSYLYYTTTSLGKTYHFFELFARPTSVNGRLYNANLNQTLTNSGTLATQIANVYKEKIIGSLIGKIPFVSWLPYELFGSANTYASYGANNTYASIRTNTTMSYIYVSEDYSFWNLAISSNWVQTEFLGTIYLTGPQGQFATDNYYKISGLSTDNYSDWVLALSLYQSARNRGGYITSPYYAGLDGTTFAFGNAKVTCDIRFYWWPSYL